MKRLLVTGASGLLGLNLALQASDRYEVLGVLRNPDFEPAAHTPFNVCYVDLVQPGAVERLLDEAVPDAVIHCAALTDVDLCEAHPQDAQELNAHLPETLARATARRGIFLLHISTDAVFDGERGGYTESDPANPINVYARTKLEGELRVAEANPNAVVARVNFYGWSWTGKRSLAEFFFSNLLAGKAVRGFSNMVFSPLLVGDLVETLLKIADARLNGLYHVVSPEPINKCEFGRLLARTFGFDEQLVSPSTYGTGDLKARRSRCVSLRSEKISQALGGVLPGQAEAMRHFCDQYRQGYCDTLRGVLVKKV